MTKALTLTQPWATLVALGIKKVETRSWATGHRGPILIHAAKGWTRDDMRFAVDLHRRGILPLDPHDLPRGQIIARAVIRYVGPTVPAYSLVEGLELELGDFTYSRFGWTLTQVEPLPEPVPWRGSLGLWDGPDL